MKNRYSKYVRPLLLLIDIVIINIILFFILGNQNKGYFLHLYISVYWLITSAFIGYYKVYRYTTSYRVLSLVFKQSILYVLGFFAFFGLFKEGYIVNEQFITLGITIGLLLFTKIVFFILIKNYRRLGNNYRKVVFVETDKTTKKIIRLFQQKKNLGYNVIGYFSKSSSESALYLGNYKEISTYVLQNNIDEIYGTLSELSKQEVKELTKFSNDNNIQLKLIPNSNGLYSKHQEAEVYEDVFKVLNVKKLPFQLEENKLIKRVFDVVFSFFVILLIMSWLIPVLWVLVKLESKGPLFFTQEREGLNGGRFFCYKFRSMRTNIEANKQQAVKGDVRITKIGAFMRKTSIDELPQFFNVFLGNMSVVGPRPHMDAHSIKFEQEINNYIKRHAVKPGITGLAQIRGYRGEIKKKSDIENRVRLDVFYIENWSFKLDIKIIVNTVLNVFKGEENAY